MKAKNSLMFVSGFLTSILCVILVLGIALGVLGTTKRVSDISKLNPQIGNVIDPNSELGKKTLLQAYQMIKKDLDKFENMTLGELKKKYGINIPDTLPGQLRFIKLSVLFNTKLKDLTHTFADKLLDSFSVEEALKSLNLHKTVKTSAPFNVLHGSDGLLSKSPFKLKEQFAKEPLLDYLQNHITFGELSKQLGIDLEKDDAFKNIDAFKDINSKSLKDSIDFFKTIDSKLKIRDVFNFAKIEKDKLSLLEEKGVLDLTFKEFADQKDELLKSIILTDVVDVNLSPYYQDDSGEYVFIAEPKKILCDPLVFDRLNGRRFNKIVQTIDGKTETSFEEDPTGAYLEYNYGYFTLYNPSNEKHASLKRYRLADSSDHSIADPRRIKADTDLFAFNKHTKSFEPYVSGKYDLLYVKNVPSTKILQRFATLQFKNPDNILKELVLSDVVDVKPDTYHFVETVSLHTTLDPDAKYAVFENDRFITINHLLPNFKSAYEGQKLYKLVSSGSSEKLLKLFAFVGFNDGATKINNLFKSFTLNELIDVEPDKYEPASDGDYVFVRDGKAGYFTLYNAAIHDASETRYSKTFKSSTNNVLKRVSHTKVNDIKSSFNSLILGELIDINNDTFVSANDFIKKFNYSSTPDGNSPIYIADPSTSCFRYNSDIGSYEACENPLIGLKYYKYLDGAYTLLDSFEPNCFVKTKVGTSHAVLKKLSFTKFDDLSTNAESLLKSMFFDEILDIENYDIVRIPSTSGTPSYFSNAYANEKDETFTFIEDSKGQYKVASRLYVQANEKQLKDKFAAGSPKTVKFKWVNLKDKIEYLVTHNGKTPIEALNSLVADEYLFVSHGGKYVFNTPWALTRINRAKAELLKPHLGNFANANVFLREEQASPIAGIHGEFSPYKNKHLNIYDPIHEKYLPYTDDTSVPGANQKAYLSLGDSTAHLYYVLKDGYYPADEYTPQEELFEENTALNHDGSFVDDSYIRSTTPLDFTNKQYYRLLKYKDNSGVTQILTKYFSPTSDTANNFVDPTSLTYSKVLCNTTLFEDEHGDYKLFDGNIVKISKDETYTGKRYFAHIGHVANSGSIPELSSTVDLLTAKSSKILRALSKKKAKVDNIDTVVKTLQLQDLISAPKRSIFQHPTLSHSTLENVADNFNTLMKTVTFGDLCDYGEYYVEAKTLEYLKNISLEKFILSIKFTNDGLVIDHDVLFA